MKLLLIGNHTCGNRGDGAILRGLLEEIQRQHRGADVTVTSRYPVSSSFLLGHVTVPDPFHEWHKGLAAGLISKLKSKVAKYAVPVLMMLEIRTGWAWLRSLLPKPLQGEIERLKTNDAVIQVGGSFFVDLYGVGQFEYAFAAILAGRPLFLIGHSMGPFEGWLYRHLAHTLLSRASQVALREPVSLEMIVAENLPTQRVLAGSDTAWLVDSQGRIPTGVAWLERRTEPRPVIVITVRELAPFDKRLGVTQQAYERAFSDLVKELIANGYDVIAASTCTGIDGYHRDDRMNALRVGRDVDDKDHFHVVMDELNDVELGALFSRCVLLIGTRLHSAIIALNFGTPAIAINYEHKSEGVMRQLGLETFSRPISDLLNRKLVEHVFDNLERLDDVRAEIQSAVAREREQATAMLVQCLEMVSTYRKDA